MLDNTTYYYRIEAITPDGISPVTEEISATTLAAIAPTTTGPPPTSVPTTYTVTVSGSISPGNSTVNHGTTRSFTVKPSAGYTASVSGCGGTLAGNIYTTAAITADCAVTASFPVTVVGFGL